VQAIRMPSAICRATATLADGTVTIPNRSLINSGPSVLLWTPSPSTASHRRSIFRRLRDRSASALRKPSALSACRSHPRRRFVESIADQTLLNLAASQCSNTGGLICGETVRVPVLEANGALAVGRFGWKNQHASLLSFSSDAYLNEMGVSNRLPPNNVDVTRICDVIADPNNATPDAQGLEDIDRFARFMRPPKRRPATRLLRIPPTVWPCQPVPCGRL